MLKAAWLRHFPCCAYIDGAVAPAVTTAPAVQAASAIPATGDDVNLALLWALLVISGGAAAVLYSKRKRE